MSQYYIMRLLYFWSSKYSIDEQNLFFEKHLSFKNKKLCLEKQWTIKSLLIYYFFAMACDPLKLRDLLAAIIF